MTDPITESEKKELVNRAITQAYPKMQKDFSRITSYNSIRFDDLLQFCLSEFMTKKSLDYQYKVCVIDDKLVNWMGRSMSLNLKSSTSPYWNTYRKEAYNSRGVYLSEYNEHGKHELPETPTELFLKPEERSPLECVMHALEQLDFYHRQLLEDYYIKDWNYKEIHKKYGIPLHHVRLDIQTGVKLIQEKCEQFKPNK
jgi:hypothetical protein